MTTDPVPSPAPAPAAAHVAEQGERQRELHPTKEAYLPVNSDPPNWDVRVGLIVAAKPTPKALVPAMFLTIDFGPILGIKTTSTQIVKQHPDPEALIGTKVCCVVNVNRIRLGKLYSEVLTLGVESEEGGTVLVRPDPRAKIGARVF